MTIKDTKDQTIDPIDMPESTLDTELDTLVEEATLIEPIEVSHTDELTQL